MLSGCVAAAIPVAAAAFVARKELRGEREGDAPQSKPQDAQAGQTSPEVISIRPGVLPPPTGVRPQPAPAPAGMQYLYGSGEAAALSVQAYQALWTYLSQRAAERKAGRPVASAVLAAGATLVAPVWEECDGKPLAVVLDVDETVLLNLGYEADDARRGGVYDDSRWQRWEETGVTKVAPVPGAVDTLAAARREGVTVIFNSNRSAVTAPYTEAAINGAGLGPAVHGKTLWLKGDAGTGSAKDPRRWAISKAYCVVALVGDQLGDFSDLFNAPELSPAIRRNAATETMVGTLWGGGWFLLPNPVYGTALRGGIDEIFPADKQWADPAGEK
jgi:5'-nucleotidase (lipoprotein e(P4) family)